MTGRRKLQFSLFTLFLMTGVITTVQALPFEKTVFKHGGGYIDLKPFLAKAHDGFLGNYPYAETNIFDLTVTDIGNDTTLRRDDHFFFIDNEWNYKITLGYDIPSCNYCGYGFSLGYVHYNTSDHQHLEEVVNNQGSPSLRPFARNLVLPFAVDTGFDSVDAKINYNYDTLDILGHTNIAFCNRVDVQLFAGARYLDLSQDTRSHFFVAFDSDVISFTDDLVQEFGSNFNGIGPVCGVDVFYQIANGFGLTMGVGGNLLFGGSKCRYKETLLFSGEEAGEDAAFDGEDINRHPRESLIVPGLSGKIGIAFRTVFCNCSSLAIEVGYEGDKYFNVSEVSPLVQSVLGENSKAHDYNDFNISGPYLSLSYHL